MNNQVPADQELIDYYTLSKTNTQLLVHTHELEKTSIAIFTTLFNALLKNEKVLLISSDKSVTARVQQLLELFNLQIHVKVFSENRPINANELSSFQKANIPTKSLSQQDLQTMHAFSKKEEDELFHNYHKIQQEVFGKKSLLTILETHQKAKYFTKGEHKHLNIDLSEFCFNQNEFWELRKEIQSCIEYYNPIFNTLDQTGILSNSMVNKMADQENLDLLKIELNQKITSIDSLIDQLTGHLDTQSEKLYTEKIDLKNQTIKQLKTLREQLIFIKYHQNNQKQSILGIKNKTKHDYGPLEKKLDDCLSALEQDPYFLKITNKLNRELSQDKLSELIEYVQNLEVKSIFFRNYAQRLNVNHMSVEEREKIQNRLLRFVEKLNSSDFFEEDIELSDFTIQHQVDSLKSVKNDLRSIFDLYQQLPSYIKWRVQFKQISNKARRIIDQLRYLSLENWLHYFEAWFIEQIIIQNQNHLRSINQHSFDYLLKLNKINRQENLAFISNQRSLRREQAKQNLKNKDKAKFKQLFANQPSNYSLAELFKNEYELMTDYWPIVITGAEQLKYLSSTTEIFDLKILIEPDDKYLDQYANALGSESRCHIFKSPANQFNLSRFEIELTDEQSTQFSLAYPNLHNSEKAKSIGDKLKSAKRLAQNLVAINPKFAIYQSKNLSILSYWSNFKNKNLEAELESEFIKKIEDSQDENSITEALLVEDKQILVLLENGLINSATPENYDWQIYLLQGLQFRSVQCFNYYSSELYTEGEDHFKSLLRLIKSASNTEEALPLKTEVASHVS